MKNSNSIIDQSSLASTIDNLNQLIFDGIKIKSPDKKESANWLSSRQGLPGSYWGMFAPTTSDYKGITLFTGEKLTSKASIGHILGEETCRILYLLNIPETFTAITNSQKGLSSAIKRAYDMGYYSKGYYCCGKCTAAYWRNLSADLEKNKKILKAGIKILKSYRDGNEKWKIFPFYYTLYSLSGIDLPDAKEELRYASGVCERIASRKPFDDKYAKRRYRLAEKVLSMI